jgi:SLT domain-containing protein
MVKYYTEKTMTNGSFQAVLPKGKLFEVDIIYNNIENPILLLQAVDESQAMRYLNRTYGRTHHFSILKFRSVASKEKANPRAFYKDIRHEKWWNSETTQKIKYIKLPDEAPRYIKI